MGAPVPGKGGRAAGPRLVRIVWRVSAALLVAAAAAGPAGIAAGQALDLARANGAVRGLDAVDIDGNGWSFADLSGRVVLIDFWATWCAPCLAEIPYMQRQVERHGEDFLILGVSLDRRARRNVVKWLNQQRVDWPQVHDGRGFGGDLALAFGVERLPTSVLIDHRGRVRAFSPRGEDLVAAVDRLVAELRAASSGEISPPGGEAYDTTQR